MTRNQPARERTPGYRGALPTRDDRLARPWIVAVIAAFLLILALSAAGIPSRLIPDPTPVPLPSISPIGSPAASAEASESPEASGSAESSASAQPSPTEE